MEATGPIFRNVDRGQTPRQAAASEPTALATDEVVYATPRQVEDTLTENVTSGYKPRLPVYRFREGEFSLWDFYWDIESMLKHDMILTPLANVQAPIQHMEVEFAGSSTRVVKSCLDEWQKFLECHVPTIQQDADPYGWMGAEIIYGYEQGRMTVDDIQDYHPRDVQPLVKDGKVHGVQVKNVPGGAKNLAGSRRGLPAKGFWYPRKPKYGMRYGQAAIETAWKPWRRATARDGMEEVMDLACYRYAVGYMIGYAPAEDTTALNQPAAGGAKISAIQRMLEMIENLKAGAGIVLPSTVFPTGQSKYSLDFKTPEMRLEELLTMYEALYKQCSKAIGFPPELLEASETGSGYSGRLIPLQAFLYRLQGICVGLFRAYWKQIGKPLMYWNFGPAAWCRPRVMRLDQTLLGKGQQPQMPGAGGPPGQMPKIPGMGGQQPGAPATAGGEPQAVPGQGGDPNAKTPYSGPRGGKGWRDAQNRVHYGALMSSHAFNVARRAVIDLRDRDEDNERALTILRNALPDLEGEELEIIEDGLRRAA